MPPWTVPAPANGGVALPAGASQPGPLQTQWSPCPCSGGHPGRTPQVDMMPFFSPLTLRNSAMLEKYFWLASATFFSAACGFTISRP